jgi:hypothetical protein
MVLDTSGSTHRLVVAAGEPRAGGIAISNANGAFGGAGLPAGGYYICVSPPTDLHADPCVWNSGKVKFIVSSGSTVSLQPITIYAGVRVNFVITDSQRLLPASGSQLTPAAIVGVLTPNAGYQPATVVSRNGAVVQATITVPHNKPVTAWLFSRTLKFQDSSAKAVTVGPGAPITLPAGITDYNISLTVTK